jgi:hypothetical protein
MTHYLHYMNADHDSLASIVKSGLTYDDDITQSRHRD